MQTILAVTCVVFCVCANGIHWLRGYFRWIDECCSQLQNFSMEKAHSHCCKSNHVNEEGSQIMCDRKIISECICLWFGSEEAFESCVRSDVATVLIEGVSDLLVMCLICVKQRLGSGMEGFVSSYFFTERVVDLVAELLILSILMASWPR